jgi:hypothetical protein
MTAIDRCARGLDTGRNDLIRRQKKSTRARITQLDSKTVLHM